MIVYADSSFLISSYVQDSHVNEFLRRIATHPTVWTTPFHKVETAHGIHLHVFHKRLSHDAASRAWKHFLQDCAIGIWMTVPFPEKAWETGIGLAQRFAPTLGVRTLDSLHVACALELKTQKFWTFDDRQARLAEAVGLDTTA